MTPKYTVHINVKIEPALNCAIDNLVAFLPEGSTRSDAFRLVLELGLKKAWKKINKDA